MSSNIYEDPSLTVNVGYSKAARAAGGERVERVVDIYESEDAGGRDWTCNRVSEAERRKTCSRRLQAGPETRSLQQGQNGPSVHRSLLGAAALVLALICLLLVAAVIVLSRLYSDTLEKEQLQKQPQVGMDKPSNQTNNTGWTICYYISTEMKNWTESRTDCRSRGADLVVINNREEQNFIKTVNERGAAWIGLRSVKKNQQELEWKWVDGSAARYQVWGSGVNVYPANDSAVFLSPEGVWNHTEVGSKYWICEKQKC